MSQMTIFEAIDNKPKNIGLLHRCHLYHNDTFKYTAFPSLKGMKVIGIRSSDVHDMTADEYRRWINENGYEEREPT